MNFKNAGLWVRLTAEESGLNFIQMENEIKPQIFSFALCFECVCVFFVEIYFQQPITFHFPLCLQFFLSFLWISILSNSFLIGHTLSIGRNGKRQKTLLYLCFVKINLWCTVIVTEPSKKIWPKGFSNEFECLFRNVRNADSWFFRL